ncbi:HD domain-containing protein [Desulfurococcus mucosus]|uniref:Metal dependent phosphohydrolase n=1 Tax=Desulfurococcus mucosus (strain ATCC 35584 / DSM 2162 / JCM 9187 / O7/1) TaxID=765177 RepID=E8R841_DESM0|nr:HD domain-containing protein [Desulfurococcus mucosus]ADV64667.1 metal dependent phosphohydrolase [Desulfurococcus mucosus DSM 2162]
MASQSGEQGGEPALSLFMPFNAQVRDPIYGYIDYVKGFEDEVIDSWVLQRLRYVYQLQAAHFIYPGATHTRFSHSLGVMYSSYRYMSFLMRSAVVSGIQGERRRSVLEYQRELIYASRLLGLLHDIGHGPFSHAFDRYVYKNKDFLGYRVGNHEVVGYLLYRSTVRDIIEKTLLRERERLQVDPEVLISLLDEGMKPPRGMRDFTDLQGKGVLGNSDFYDPSVPHGLENIVRLVVRDYVYTSDIMDYLRRDSYYTGVPVGQINDDWIMRNSYIVDKGGILTPAISSKALDEVARLFDARKIMYKHVYLHPVNQAFIETIGMLLPCIRGEIVEAVARVIEEGDAVAYLALTDHYVYSAFKKLLVNGLDNADCVDKAVARSALESLFIKRKPVWKMVKRIIADLRTAGHLYGRFGETLQKKIEEGVSSEVSTALPGRDIGHGDLKIMFDKIDIYPSAGAEVLNTLEVVELKDGRVIESSSKSLEEFAKESGLIPEALITVYINRLKYQVLTSEELRKISEIATRIVEDAIKGTRRESPETS